MHLGYYLPVLVMRIFLKLLSHLKVIGKENIPPKGPLVIVSNHLSMIDPPLLAACFNRRIVFIAKEEAFDWPVLGFFVRNFGSISVRRGQADRQALRDADEELAQGAALGIFPEGTRSRNGRLQKGYAGAAFLAIRSGAPILPAAITGTEKVKGLLSVLKRPEITVTIGKPFLLPTARERADRKRLDELTDEIMKRVAELLPESYQGVYAQEVIQGSPSVEEG